MDRCVDTALNIVPGQGPIPCDVMIIGEAPGKNEQEQGMPFIGRAGQVLNEALKFGGLARDEVYITNVYKTRPPNNRTPTDSELEEHWPLLVEELVKVNPKFMLLLGNTPLYVFTETKGITKKHGNRVDMSYFPGDRIAMCTFHPAATVYNKGVRQDFYDDVKHFADLVRTYTNE
jgi:uracil-DNA glycosylase family 4